jgi:hypothetical protein
MTAGYPVGAELESQSVTSNAQPLENKELQVRRQSRLSTGKRYSTASSAFGSLAATNSSVRAAPEGERRPCSQS